MKTQRIGIIGIGQSQFQAKRPDRNYPELVREAVSLALTDCELDLEQMEAVVFSLAPDALLGIGNAERLGVDAVSAANKPFMRINTGGSTGISSLIAAYTHIAAGVCDVVLTAGADKVGECGDSQTILNKIWDPSYERALPLGTITMLAMSAVRYAEKYGMTEEDMARVVVKNRFHASLNPNAHLRKLTTIEEVMESRYISWPIKLFDCCPQSSGGCAMVLASERYIKENKLEAVWITGVGHASESYFIGDRMGNHQIADHADAQALKEACDEAYRMAGIRNPAQDIDVAELYAPFSNTEFHAIEAAGLAGLGASPAMLREGAFYIGSKTPVNPSGGTLCSNAIAVTAMVRAAEIAQQVRGRAGGHQVQGAKKGIASGNGGDHQFFGTMVHGLRTTFPVPLGETASWFFTQLRDNAKIYGRRCPESKRVLVPPRSFSDQTLEPTTDWVEVGPAGKIETFTIVYESFKNLPPPPYAFGYVLLEGADTAIGGYFKGIDLNDPAAAARLLKVGTKVMTRFSETRTGDVLDFWFEII